MTTLRASKETAEKQFLEKLRAFQKQEPSNRRCADCADIGPTYICMDFGTFICTTCAGLHREFNHKVKGVSVSRWTEPEVNFILKHGNAKAQSKYLQHLDPSKLKHAPEPGELTRLRTWIREKYIDQRWVYPSVQAPPSPPLPQQKLTTANLLLSQSKSSSQSNSPSSSAPSSSKKSKKKKTKKHQEEEPAPFDLLGGFSPPNPPQEPLPSTPSFPLLNASLPDDLFSPKREEPFAAPVTAPLAPFQLDMLNDPKAKNAHLANDLASNLTSQQRFTGDPFAALATELLQSNPAAPDPPTVNASVLPSQAVLATHIAAIKNATDPDLPSPTSGSPPFFPSESDWGSREPAAAAAPSSGDGWADFNSVPAFIESAINSTPSLNPFAARPGPTL